MKENVSGCFFSEHSVVFNESVWSIVIFCWAAVQQSVAKQVLLHGPCQADLSASCKSVWSLKRLIPLAEHDSRWIMTARFCILDVLLNLFRLFHQLTGTKLETCGSQNDCGYSEASSSCIKVYNKRQQFHMTIWYPLFCFLFLLTELSSFVFQMQQFCKVVS